MNDFYNWYHDKIAENLTAKKALIEQNPDLALRVFAVFQDKQIAHIFVEMYITDQYRHHSAWLVSRELGLKIQRAFNKEEIEQPYKPDQVIKNIIKQGSWCGTLHPDSMWRQEAGWDDVVRAYDSCFDNIE